MPTVALLGATVLVSGCQSPSTVKPTPLAKAPATKPASAPQRPLTGGSTAAPTRQDPAAAKPKASATGTVSHIHVVQPGETLFRIARAYGVSVESVVAANPHIVPDRLETGQKLAIPAP